MQYKLSSRKIIIIVLKLLFITHINFAQVYPLIRPYKPLDSTFTIRKNVIKINPIEAAISLGFYRVKVYEAAYERVLNKKQTVSLVIEAGDISYVENPDYVSGTMNLYLKELYINHGIRISSQYRYYFLNRKNRFPRGFYTGASPIYVYENEYYELRDENQKIIKSVKSKNNYYGIGALLGWQGMVKRGITFNVGTRLYYGYNTAKNNQDIFKRTKGGLLWDLSVGYAFGKKLSTRYNDKNTKQK